MPADRPTGAASLNIPDGDLALLGCVRPLARQWYDTCSLRRQWSVSASELSLGFAEVRTSLPAADAIDIDTMFAVTLEDQGRRVLRAHAGNGTLTPSRRVAREGRE